MISELRSRLEGRSDRRIHHYDDDGAVASLDFASFAAQAEALKRRLVEAGLQPGMRVGILGANSVHWLRWDLALIDAGCIVVAIPDELALEKGVSLLALYDLSLIVVSRASDAGKAFAGAPHATRLEDDARDAVVFRAPQGDRPLGADGACALTFSSGASGQPKCLMIDPEGIAWDVRHYIPEYEPLEDDRLLIFLPLTHQQQRLLLFATYWHGISFVLVRPDQVLTAMKDFSPTLCLAPPLLYEGIHERYLTAVSMLPVWKRRLADTLGTLARALPSVLARPLQRAVYGRIHDALGGRMRLMITGMAPIHLQVLEFFNAIGIPLYEAYGLTETGVIASNSPRGNKPGSVGRAVAGCEVRIGDDGEVLVRRRRCTALGYFDPDGGGEIFERDGFVATGDIGRLDDDGYLHLLGRKKEIIITSQGIKIHPERIEDVLNTHPAISRSVVFTMGGSLLAAVLQTRVPITPELQVELESFATGVALKVSSQATIKKTVLTDQPFSLGNGLLTRSLKINRRAVERRFAPELFAASNETTEPTAEDLAGVPPETIALVRRVWEEVLERPNLPLMVDIFELGGDSLLAMRILARLREETGREVVVTELLASPTILGVARRLAQAQAAAEADAKREETMVEGAI